MRFGIYSYLNPEDAAEAGKSDFYRIELCVRGSQKLSLGPDTFTCVKGTLNFVSPGQMFSILDRSVDFQSYVIVLNQQLINEFLVDGKIPYINSFFDLGVTPFLQLSEEDCQRTETFFVEIDAEIKNDRPDNLAAIKLLIGLIALIARRVHRQGTPGKGGTFYRQPLHRDEMDKMFQVKKCILADLSTPPDLYALSRQVGFSESKLKQLFRRTFGSSIFHYYQAARMYEAARLLRYYSVAETGYRLGFSNLSHFARLFERHHSVMPKKFKDNLVAGGGADTQYKPQ